MGHIVNDRTTKPDRTGNGGDFSGGEKNSPANSQQRSFADYTNQQQQQPMMKNQSAEKHDGQDNGQPSTTSSASTTRLYRKRWAILIIFCCLSMSNAFQWIQYAIITSIMTRFYGVNEIAINWTSMIYMLTYIPLVFPATFLLDKYGLRVSAILGATGNCLGACLKCLATRPDRFYLTFIAQTISGASQIFTLGLPARIAAIWFGPQELSTATSIGVFGNQLGIALGCLIPPMIVTNFKDIVARQMKDNYTDDILTNLSAEDDVIFTDLLQKRVSIDMDYLSYPLAACTLLILVMVLAFFREKPTVPPSYAQLRAMQSGMEKNYLASLKGLCCNHNFVLLIISYGINTGAFYAVSTLLNQILLKYFEGEEVNIGRIGLVIVLAGLFGSISLGYLLDRTKAFKSTTLVVYALSLAGMVLYTVVITFEILWIVFVVSFFMGFFMTGYLALGFEFASELTHPTSEATSSGLLNAAAQFFGIIMTLGMGELDIHVSPLACNIALSVCLTIGLIVTALIKADLRRQHAETKRFSTCEGNPAIKTYSNNLISSGSDQTDNFEPVLLSP